MVRRCVRQKGESTNRLARSQMNPFRNPLGFEDVDEVITRQQASSTLILNKVVVRLLDGCWRVVGISQLLFMGLS